ncbi:GntR family transcriptional regulator [Salipaludibacillus sp. CUR1]|uniref:GntR family transcriptional regulator n=1 Tax=Salipaludibacillus sp. CUR1 TaxID=2820003 RepID=UPI001E35F311|nr:GntR family transcriptional regulator [Salipaludibacillus sp. CUR1]MCE7794466.1 GntR family transcriptional regulator [Salipaludibacillus sp. CUR1]
MSKNQRKLPLYVQIKNKLVTNIKEEVWKPGDPIPSESQLMEQFNVSRTTIRQAIRDLAQTGIVETRRGMPARIRQAPAEDFANPGVIHHESGNDMGVTVLRAELTNTHFLAKANLELDDSEEVYYLERIRLADGKPIAYQQLFVPEYIRELIKPSESETFDIFPSLGKHGVNFSTIKENVSAANTGRYEADLLGIIPGEALIDISRTTIGTDGCPIEYSRTRYKPESFNYRVEIGR